jgi:iron complex outermembrane receptor protein
VAWAAIIALVVLALIPTQHAAHIISFNAVNLGDTLYRNHLSFIKEFAPEMGRGFRVTYTLRFY